MLFIFSYIFKYDYILSIIDSIQLFIYLFIARRFLKIFYMLNKGKKITQFYNMYVNINN